MQEALLHYIWQYRQYSTLGLKTQCGQSLSVLKVGMHNSDAGPDFENARIRLGSMEWVGQVEIHIKSSDWLKHHHQKDAAYNNVILHVVWEDDLPIVNQSGEEMPTLELAPLVDREMLDSYRLLMNSRLWIPCQSRIHEVGEEHLSSFLERLLIERMEEKSITLKGVLYLNNMDWEETFYQFFCKSLGMKINAEPMFQLACQLPQKLLAKHRRDSLQLEALLFGVAGFLEEAKDDYSFQLRKEFQFLKHKYQLGVMQRSSWKFLRLRPAAFPTLRIAQLAQLMRNNTHLFSRILEADSIKALEKLLQVQVSGYWETHYQFSKKSVKRKKRFGKELIRSIIVNTVIPFLFLYSKEKGLERFQTKALLFLKMLSAERNAIIRQFHKFGIYAENAGQTQALLQLKNNYCVKKKCLKCVVGMQLLNRV